MLNKLKSDLLEARKNKNEVLISLLRSLIGEIELVITKVDNDKILSIIKWFIKSNNETLKALSSDFYKDSPLISQLEEENKYLQKLLPESLSQEDIKNHLTQHCLDSIIDAKSDGAAMAVAMGFFKSNGLNANGPDVKCVVSTIRS